MRPPTVLTINGTSPSDNARIAGVSDTFGVITWTEQEGRTLLDGLGVSRDITADGQTIVGHSEFPSIDLFTATVWNLNSQTGEYERFAVWRSDINTLPSEVFGISPDGQLAVGISRDVSRDKQTSIPVPTIWKYTEDPALEVTPGSRRELQFIYNSDGVTKFIGGAIAAAGNGIIGIDSFDGAYLYHENHPLFENPEYPDNSPVSHIPRLLSDILTEKEVDTKGVFFETIRAVTYNPATGFLHVAGRTDFGNVFSSYIASVRINDVETPVEPPSSFMVFRGLTLSAQLSDFTLSDDISARFNPGFVLSSAEAPVWLVFDANVPDATSFSIESSAGTPGLTYTFEAFNQNTSSFDVIGQQPESFNNDVVTSFDIDPANHVGAAGEVESRVGWRQTGFTLNFPWEVRVDQVGWID